MGSQSIPEERKDNYDSCKAGGHDQECGCQGQNSQQRNYLQGGGYLIRAGGLPNPQIKTGDGNGLGE